MEKHNIIDTLKSEHAIAKSNRVIKAMQMLLNKVLGGAEKILKSAINNDLDEVMLFISVEDTEIEGYPIQFLLGLEKYEGKDVGEFVDTGLSIIKREMKKLDDRIDVTTKKSDDYLMIWADWKVGK